MFTLLIGFLTLRTVLLFAIYRYSSAHLYLVVYWSGAFLEVILQVAFVFEMARVVLKPTGTWVRDARKMFLVLGITGAAVAALIAYIINPSSPNTLDFWIEKGNLFFAMLVVELVVSMIFASTQLGLVGNSHIMRLGKGWALWAVVALVTEGAYSHFGANWHGVVLDYARTFTYFFVTIYWIITLWRPEPKRRTLSPEMQTYLDNLHQQLQLDLSRVGKIEKH